MATRSKSFHRTVSLLASLAAACAVLAAPAANAVEIDPALRNDLSAPAGDLDDPSVLRLTSDVKEPQPGQIVTYDIAVDNTTGRPMTNARLDTYIRTRITTYIPTDGDCGLDMPPPPVAGDTGRNQFLQIRLGTLDVGESVRCSITLKWADDIGSVLYDDFTQGAANFTITNQPGPQDPNFPIGWQAQGFEASGVAGSTAALHTVELTEPFAVTANSVLAFRHFFFLENGRDGGVVEATIDDGQTWFDLGPYFDSFIQGGGFTYTGSIPAGSDNPLAGREVFSGSTTNRPTAKIELRAFAGEQMRVRFALGTDGQNDRIAGSSGPGAWVVEDFHVYGGEFAHLVYVDLFSDQTRPGIDSFFASIVYDYTAPDPDEFLQTIGPRRFLDSRNRNDSSGTLDEMSIDMGVRPAGTVTEVPIHGRGSLPGDRPFVVIPDGARAVVVNVSAINPEGDGYVTVYPCSESVPNTADLNFTAGVNIGNEVIAELSPSGSLCFFNSAPTNIVADISGYIVGGSDLGTVGPSRLVDTRATGTTVDGRYQRAGRLVAGEQLTIDIAGRAGVPADAESVIVNAVAISPDGTGFLTLHPCLADRPNSSSLNYAAATTRGNQVTAEISAAGTICVYTSAATHLTVDVAGFVAPTDDAASVSPARVLDTRTNGDTVDDRFERIGRLSAGGVTRIDLGGRAGVPADAQAALLNITAVGPSGVGFVTIFTCGLRPRTSNLNHGTGINSGNDVVAALNRSGQVCFYNSAETDLVVDVVGYIDGPVTLVAGEVNPTPSPTPILVTVPARGSISI